MWFVHTLTVETKLHRAANMRKFDGIWTEYTSLHEYIGVGIFQ